MGCTQTSDNNQVFIPAIRNKNMISFSTADMVNERRLYHTKSADRLGYLFKKGAFGEVRKAKLKNSDIFRAIKIIEKARQTPEEQQKLINEVNILKKLDHPNIIKIFEFYQDKNRFYIVTELCTGGELFDFIINQGILNEQMAANIIRKVISVLMYCHIHKVVHRDLKPENLLLVTKTQNLEEIEIKVIDFGTSISIESKKKLTGKYGTAYYVAPEILNEQQYNEKCDIWSVGVILYILLSGVPPFNGINDIDIIQKIKTGKISYRSESWNNVSEECIDLLKNMLQYDVNKRYSAEQVMNHRWMQSHKIQNSNLKDNSQIISALQNMKKFNVQNKIQEATYLFLSNHLTNKEQHQKLLQMFQQIDQNGDGQLSYQELLTGYTNSKIPNPVFVVKQIFERVDKNCSGFIDYHEFVMAASDMQATLSKENLISAFQMLDKDGNGSISIKELQSIFGNNLPQSIWEQMIKEADENNDGELQFEEFKKLLMNMQNNHQN